VSVYALSPTTAWIGGLGDIGQTTDSGATWTIERPSETNWYAITFLDANNGWAGGRDQPFDDLPGSIWKWSKSVTPTSVVSRKTHGPAGTFDIDLPLTGSAGIECRSGGTSNDYQMVVTFANPVTLSTAQVTSGTGSVSSFSVSADGTQVTVNLTGVANVQRIAMTLFGVSDGTHTNDVVLQMGVLVGDTSANGIVNSSDIGQTKSRSGQALTSVNFRSDVTVSGTINASDLALVKSKSGIALP
jgi:hypothetical protein